MRTHGLGVDLTERARRAAEPLGRLAAVSGPFLVLGAVVAGIVFPETPASGQSRTASHSASHSVVARSKLVLSSGSLLFPSADPDTVPEVAATGGALTIQVRATVSAGDPVTLTVVASDDLRSGLDAIPASALHWTGSGPGFAALGTMSAAVPQPVGNWSGSGAWTGLQTYLLTNSWSHPTGTFTTTLLYTLTTP
ncbi:MAG: hypothetical protein AB1806_14310 [Acidobacteriota bacterium]